MSLFGEEIDKMPIRGVEAVIAMTPGVIRINDDFHLRGGRSDEMNTYLDGINISSALGGSMQIPVIPNAIEAVTVLPGGFPAEYGGKMSGVASVRLKTGGSKYKITGEVITDDFWAFKNDAGSHQILGIDKLYSFGYNDYILTISGPVIPRRDDLRFFIAGQASNRMSSATWFEGFHQDLIRLPGTWRLLHGQYYRDTLDLVMDVPPGRLPGGGREWKTLQGNLLWNFKSLRFKMSWTRHRGRSNPETADPQYLISTPIRSRRDVQRIDELHFNISHSVNSSLYYSIRAGMVSAQSEFGDPVWWDDWLSYADPGKNPALIDTSQKHRGYPLSFDSRFSIPYPGTPYDTYGKDEEEKLTAAFDLTKHLCRIHELKIGGEFMQSKLRRFRFDAFEYMRRLRDVGLDPESYTEYDVYSYLAAFFGYDWFGNEIEEDMVVSTKLGQPYPVEVNLKNGPPKPIYAGIYIQDRIEYEKLIINAGVRLEYMKNGLPALKSLTDFSFDRQIIDEENWVDQKSYTYLSPRVGFSFAATKHTVFHVQAGRYIQPPDLSQMWIMTGYDPSSFRNLSYDQGFYPHLNPNLK
ncbi:TonB-dependent receptor, partial [bacterium]|nr:TonB-dependent receptor [bacterium]